MTQVTLVSNLEQFGFNLQALSHVCQQGVAASCGVTRSPGSKYDQLMLQGDQVSPDLLNHRYIYKTSLAT
jgi:translation initiation factor 1 (eIF-1/SUI1)